MKAFIKKIMATVLSLVVLFSSISFTIDKHFCGETLIDVSYFGEADKCGMEGMEMNSNAKRVKKKKCCKDETIFVESSTFDKEKVITLQSIDLEFVFSYAYSYINLYQNITLEKEYYKDFSPPDVEQDIRILHQTFLI
jgi:hypothetical protein